MRRERGLLPGECGRYRIGSSLPEGAWNLAEAVAFLAALQPTAFEAGFNLSLGGGVLNRGYSETDLDVVAVPRRAGCEVRQLRRVLESAGCSVLGFEKVHPGVQVLFQVGARKVEMLIACGERRDRYLRRAVLSCDGCETLCCESDAGPCVCGHTGLPCHHCPEGTMQPESKP
jgi:hypothetical protein